MKDSNQSVLRDSNGKPRPPVTTAEQLVSSVFGGSPMPAAYDAVSTPRLNKSRSVMKLEFTNLPPDANTHRLHQGLNSVIPSEVTCDIHQVKIAYGTLHGKATGYGSVSLRNVPANESVMKSIRESQANGSWKFGSARVAYDDRRDERGIPVPDAARGIHAKLAGVSNAKEPPGTPRSMPRGTPREVSRSGGTPRSGSVRV